MSNKPVKSIGLIGGMSWASTAVYYQLLNQRLNACLGGFHSAPIMLVSVDFEEIVQYQKRGDWQAAARALVHHAQSLEQAGAQLLILCTNTMHIIADEIASSVEIPFINIIDSTAAVINAKGYKKPLLLATRYTMEQGFYQQRMMQNGVEITIPHDDERACVHDIIFNELCYDNVTQTSRQQLINIIIKAKDNGADCVILGCTEICLSVNSDNSPLPVLDTTSLHVEQALAYAMG